MLPIQNPMGKLHTKVDLSSGVDCIYKTSSTPCSFELKLPSRPNYFAICRCFGLLRTRASKVGGYLQYNATSEWLTDAQ